MNVYVTPPAVPGAPGTGAGTEADPFTSVADGIKAAQNGGTVHLHAGHYVESVELRAVRAGRAQNRGAALRQRRGLHRLDAPRVSRTRSRRRLGSGHPTPSELRRRVRVAEPYPAPGAELGRQRVNGGAFLDEPVHIRLVSYSQLGDLRAENQLWPDDSPADGNRVWRPTTPDRTPSSPRTGRAGYTAGRRVYMGPGVWFDEAPGERRVHIRLAPTHNRIPGWDDYEPARPTPTTSDWHCLGRRTTRSSSRTATTSRSGTSAALRQPRHHPAQHMHRDHLRPLPDPVRQPRRQPADRERRDLDEPRTSGSSTA